MQVLLVACGFVLPAMFIVGGIFAALWVLALVLAARVDRVQHAYAAAREQDGST